MPDFARPVNSGTRHSSRRKNGQVLVIFAGGIVA